MMSKKLRKRVFLLETQRTLDYVISQIFRRPLDAILLQQRSPKDQQLADTINQITDIPVHLIEAPMLEQPELPFLPSLAEAGCALRSDVNQVARRKFMQHINFYFDEFRPKPLSFDIRFSAAVIALVIVGMLVIGIFEQQKLHEFETITTRKSKSGSKNSMSR